MIVVCTLLIILATAWAQYRNALFSSFAMLFKVIISGVVAFNFFEPTADSLEVSLQQSALAGCEDFLALIVIFSLTLFALRFASNYLAPEAIEHNGTVQYFGGAAVGLITGSVLAGFLVCAIQTLPLDEHFLGYETRIPGDKSLRSLFPPDRVWIAMMRHAGSVPLAAKEVQGDQDQDRYETFDRFGTFELRYSRYRRSTDSRPPMRYQGEFDMELGKQKAN